MARADKKLAVGDDVMYYPEHTPEEVGTANRTEEIYTGHPYPAKVIAINDDGTVDLHVNVHPDSGLEKDKANYHLRESVQMVGSQDDVPDSRYCKYP